MGFPSYCCQKCGKQIGWLGRLFWWLHKCPPSGMPLMPTGYRDPVPDQLPTEDLQKLRDIRVRVDVSTLGDCHECKRDYAFASNPPRRAVFEIEDGTGLCAYHASLYNAGQVPIRLRGSGHKFRSYPIGSRFAEPLTSEFYDSLVG